MASDAGYSGEMGVHSWGGDFNALDFFIDQFSAVNSHITWAKVTVVHGGGVDLPPTVDVQPLANMLNGQGQPTAHGILYGLPSYRLQGGGNAIICDPVAGDIGLAFFADRDMSSVKANRAVSNPGSRRRFDMADGVFLGGILNDAPTQYLQFIGTVLNIVLGSQINLMAPLVTTAGALTVGDGASGMFTSEDGKTVTVVSGIVTSIV